MIYFWKNGKQFMKKTECVFGKNHFFKSFVAKKMIFLLDFGGNL